MCGEIRVEILDRWSLCEEEREGEEGESGKVETGPFRLLPCGRCVYLSCIISESEETPEKCPFFVPVIAQQFFVATVPKENSKRLEMQRLKMPNCRPVLPSDLVPTVLRNAANAMQRPARENKKK